MSCVNRPWAESLINAPLRNSAMCLEKVLIVASLLLPQCSFLGIGQDSLVDLACQEERRRTSIQQEVRLFSNQDLSRLQHARVSVGEHTARGDEQTPGQVQAGEKSGKAAGKTKNNVWASRILTARERLSAAANLLHVLQLRHNHLRNLYLNAPDEIQRMRLESSLKEVLEELKQAEVEERNARQGLLEIQTEAAKAGLSPGEIREFEKEPSKAVSIVDLPATEDP